MRLAPLALAFALALPAGPSIVRAKLPVVTPPRDPYRGYRIELVWASGPAAGFAGQDLLGPFDLLPPPGAPPGAPKPYKLALANGATWDSAFALWAAQSAAKPVGSGFKAFTVVLHKTSGAISGSYSVTGCWVAQFHTPVVATPGPPWPIAFLVLACNPPVRLPPSEPFPG